MYMEQKIYVTQLQFKIKRLKLLIVDSCCLYYKYKIILYQRNATNTLYTIKSFFLEFRNMYRLPIMKIQF